MALSNRPVVLFGIDGATFSILDPLIAEGRLPNLSRLKQEGAFGQLQSVIHPLTPAAWVSMVTGLNPGKHGVYDFRQRKEASYDWELVNRRSWHGIPVWSVLGKQGRQVGIFNMPMTYPPEPVHGFMIAGMGTPPKSQNFIYPDDLDTKFKERFPTYIIEPNATTNDLNEYLCRNERLLEQRLKALQFVWHEHQGLDFFMPVFVVTDRIQHVYWHFLDPDMPGYNDSITTTMRERLIAIYAKIDAVLGELWTWVANRHGYIIVASDHGFGPLVKDVYLNKWLINQGYLVLKGDTKDYNAIEERFFDLVDWSQTRAYSFGNFGNINLNIRGREPRGIVEPGHETEALKRQIIDELSQLTDPETDEVIVDAIYRKEELYSGIYLERASDLIVAMKEYAYMTRAGFDFNSNQLTGSPMEHITWYLPHSGNHRLDGVVLMAGEGIKPGSEIRDAVITDIAPTVLYMANSPIPTGLDGQILSSAFTKTFLDSHPPAYISPETDVSPPHKSFKVLLLEKDVRISLLDDELRGLRRQILEKDNIIAAQNNHIRSLEDLIQKIKNGKVMRLLAWLQELKTKLFA